MAGRKLFLGNEDGNNWCGGFDEYETVLSNDVDCVSGNFLEGVIRLESYLAAPLPEGMYLAVGCYDSPDGGSLHGQALSGDGNGDIEENEYVFFPFVSTRFDPGFPAGRLISLSSARPNPFDAATHFDLFLPSRRLVSLTVYDVRGARVTTLALGELPPGHHTFAWNGRTRSRGRAATGIVTMYESPCVAGFADDLFYYPLVEKRLARNRSDRDNDFMSEQRITLKKEQF